MYSLEEIKRSNEKAAIKQKQYRKMLEKQRKKELAWIEKNQK